MCVICIKPAGLDLPSTTRLQSMFESNSDGAGFMYARDNKIVIRKGFMKLKHFHRAIRQEQVSKDDTLIMHFRIATAGSVSPANCHPFPVTDAVTSLKSLRLETDIAMAHNGILDYAHDKENDLSDTMTFVRDILAPSHIRKHIFESSVYSLLEMAIGASKMVFLNKKGTFIILGNWVKDKESDDGLFYSNLYFSWRETKAKETQSNVTPLYRGNSYYPPREYDYGAETSGNDLFTVCPNCQKTVGALSICPYCKKKIMRSDDGMIYGTQDVNEDCVVVTPFTKVCPNCGYKIQDEKHLCCEKCGKIFYREPVTIMD